LELADESHRNNVHSYTEFSTDGPGSTTLPAAVTLYAPFPYSLLTGGSENDVLIGRSNDTFTGGGGSDTFVFNKGFGKETVTDFNPNQDQLAFNHALFAQSTAAFVLSHAHDTSFGAEIVVDRHDTVTLTNVTVAQLQAAQAANQNWINFF
jgi:Ca2+-binding RTX toxin-like protein